jgi:hypothetical protein
MVAVDKYLNILKICIALMGYYDIIKLRRMNASK